MIVSNIDNLKEKTLRDLREAGRSGEYLGQGAQYYEEFTLTFSLPVIIARILKIEPTDILKEIHTGAEEARAAKLERLSRSH